jgi:hypothetical protein
MRAGRVNGRGNRHRYSGGGNRRYAWAKKIRNKLTNNSTSVRSSDGIQTDPPKRRRWFYWQCGENAWAHRGQLCRPLVVAVPPPLFTSFKQEVRLVGGNCGIQKCDSIDSLSLAIKCLGGGGQVGGLGCCRPIILCTVQGYFWCARQRSDAICVMRPDY